MKSPNVQYTVRYTKVLDTDWTRNGAKTRTCDVNVIAVNRLPGREHLDYNDDDDDYRV